MISILWDILYFLSRFIRLISLCGFIILGSLVAMFYIIDLILYIFRLGRYYYEYLLYYYSARNKTTICTDHQRDKTVIAHKHQYYVQNDNNQGQILLTRRMDIATNVSGVDQKDNMDLNLKLLRYRFKKYYTKFFNH